MMFDKYILLHGMLNTQRQPKNPYGVTLTSSLKEERVENADV